jgi:hypothetical protein
MAIWDDIYNSVKEVVDFVRNLGGKILDPLYYMAREMAQWVNNVTMDHAQWLSGLIYNVGNSVNSLYSKLVNYIGGAFAPIISALQSVTSVITSGLSSGFSAIFNFIQSALSYLWTLINSIVTTFTFAIQNVINAVYSGLTNLVNVFTSFVTATYNQVQNFVTSSVTNMVTIMSYVQKTLIDYTVEKVSAISSGAANLALKFPESIDVIGRVIGDIGDLIPATDDAARARSFMSSVLRSIDELPTLLQGFHGPGSTTVDGGIVRLAAWIGAFVGSPMGFLPFLGDAYNNYFSPWMKNEAYDQTRPEHLSPEQLAVALRRGLIEESHYNKEMAYLGLTNDDQTTNLQLARQYLSPNELATARRRREITPDRYFETMKEVGLNDDDSETLYNITRQYFTPFEAGNLWLRGKIDDSQLDEQLRGNGVSDDDLPNWRELYLALPTPADVVHMAVREAFTPEIAERFGQYADIPDGYLDMARKVGLSEEVAKMYWASHWELPSLQMGYEMLHRGIIEPPDLDLLMKALDIMPFWRSNLVKLSYNPLTRVDVRRMHKLGVINREEVKRAYKDLGYNDENAERLTVFTELYNADPEDSESTDSDKRRVTERDRSKEDWLSGYALGMINRTDALTGLAALGYDENEQEYYIAREDYKKAKKLTDKYIEYCHDAYIKGVNTLNEVVDQLTALNLPGETIDELTQGWQIERNLRVAKPTKSEILGWVKRKMMSLVEAADELRGLGYNDKYVNLYLSGI